LQFINKPIVILSTFIGFKVFQTVASFVYGETVSYIPWVRLGIIVFLLIVTFFVLKHNNVALWVMGVYLLSNIMTVVWGLIDIPMHQYILKFFAVVLGSYFVYGGFLLIKQAMRHNQSLKRDDEPAGVPE